MHFARTRKRLTAWLGLVAMVLVFFVPVMSQQFALHASDKSHCGEAMPMASASHDMPADHHAACGYCDLLAHHVPAPAPVVLMAASAPVHAIARAAAHERFAVREARHAGRPRDSPSSPDTPAWGATA